MKLPFVKYHGAGNDFILIDLRHFSLSDPGLIARQVCQRKWGIGADGLLLLLPSSAADYRMQIFNADGSQPAMCGNGIRCLIDYIHKRIGPENLRIETPAGILSGRMINGEIAVNLGRPKVLHWPLEGTFVVDTGVPHAVLCVEDLENIDVQTSGRQIRHNPVFVPHGVNVNFMKINADKVAVRTYERGVEGETLACGTGAAAAAYVAFKEFKLPSPISIQTRGQEQLRFLITQDDEIEMLGSATEVFEGVITVSEEK